MADVREDPASAERLEAATAGALRGLFGRDALYVVVWAVQLVVAALCTPIVTRLLGPYRFGVVASSIAVMQVLVALGGAGLQTAVQWRFAKPGGERDARRLITLAIVVSALVFVVANGTGPWWCPRLGLGAYGGAVRCAVIWAALTPVSNAALGLMRSRDQLGLFALVGVLQSVVAEALSVVLVLVVARTAEQFLIGQMVAQAATVAVALAVARPAGVRARDAGMLAASLRYSICLVPAALATFALQAADRLIVQHDLGAAAVARYTVANNIGLLPILLLGVLNAVWLPRIFAVASGSLRRSILAQSRDAVYTLLIPTVVGLGIGAPIALRIWAPASYRPDGLQLVVALVAIASFPVAGLLACQRILLDGRPHVRGRRAHRRGRRRQRRPQPGARPLVGIEGSALGVLLSYGLLHLLLAVAARRAERLPGPRPTLVAGLAAAGAVALAAGRLPTAEPVLALRLAVALACLGIVVAMMRRLVRSDRRPNVARGAVASGAPLTAGVDAGTPTPTGIIR